MSLQQEWIDKTLAALLSQLGDQVPRRLTLDQIGEQVGDAPVTAQDIEALFERLEAEGVEIGESEGVDLAGLLRKVIQTALSLRKEGKRPGPAAIAERSGLSPQAVRIALLYSEVLRG